MNVFFRSVLMILTILPALSWSLTGVNPTGVNINRHGVSTVFLTFHGTANETPGDAFWCTRLNAPPNVVTSTNPCVPGTLIGALPARFDLSRPSGLLAADDPLAPGEEEGGARNTTDIMTIPASVARRALQGARAGEASAFFYVREFVSDDGLRSYVSVTCRMAGGGARSPLALVEVDPGFVDSDDRHVRFFAEQEITPKVLAKLRFTGSGRLRGRWEVVLPGEPMPSAFDLLPAASLPVEQRGLQKPYTVLSRFDVFLPPTGEFQLSGPPAERIPTRMRGAYTLLLRIDATGDKEGDSNTLDGIAQSGGVAGFPMPVIRYFVGIPESSRSLSQPVASVQLVGPPDTALIGQEQPLYLAWADSLVRQRLRLEIADGERAPVFSAMLPGGNGQYLVPRHVRERAGSRLRWRVVEVFDDGRESIGTQWRHVELLPESGLAGPLEGSKPLATTDRSH